MSSESQKVSYTLLSYSDISIGSLDAKLQGKPFSFNLSYLISTALAVLDTLKTYPAPVHHLHVKPINGRALMSPMPTNIPMTHRLNLDILNIF